MNETEIAIVGMSCVFPGAHNIDEYWSNIVNGVDSIGPVPDDRLNGGLNLAPPFSPALDEVHFSCSRGGFLPSDFRFDPLRYGILPKNLIDGDPDQFFAIAVIDAALQDAGIPEDHPVRENCDVIIGRGGYLTNKMSEGYLRVDLFPHLLLFIRQYFPQMSDKDFAEFSEAMRQSMAPVAGPDSTASAISNLVASRAANRLNLQGAAYTVDGACASSLLSVEHAVLRLRAHQCDVAVGCGVHLCQLPTFWYVFHQLGALAPSGVTRPFDRRADGILIGEGGGAVVLKRLSDAQRDGDRVYAIIKGVGSSSDGRGSAILTPRSEGQLLALKRAYRDAQVDPDSIGYLEAHGTGTHAGDPVEIQTLKSFYGEREGIPPVRAMGSMKSMIGHTMTAAGIASLIRTALAVSNKVLPPSLHCDEPTPELNGCTFYVNDRARSWIHPSHLGPRRAGINAFGFGGINVHTILEEVPEQSPQAVLPRPFRDFTSRPTELIAMSADSLAGLESCLRDVLSTLNVENHPSLAQLSRQSLETVDSRQTIKLALVCSDSEDLRSKLETCLETLEDDSLRIQTGGEIYYSDAAAIEGRVAAVFPGIGYPGVVGDYSENLMQLCLLFPEMRKVFDVIERRDEHPDDPVPTSLMLSPPGTLTEDMKLELQKRVGTALVDDMAIGSDERPAYTRNVGPVAIASADWAGWALLRSLGVRVDVVAGQSAGELAAGCASGIFNFPEVMQVLWNAVLSTPPYHGNGRLAFVTASESQIAAATSSEMDVQIAFHVAPKMQILGGPSDDLDRIIRRLREQGVVANKLPFPPIHTQGVDYLSSVLKTGSQSPFEVNAPQIPTYSSLTGGLFLDDEHEIREMAISVLNRSVRCWQTIQRMYDDGVRVFIDTGNGGLDATVKATVPKDSANVIEVTSEKTDAITGVNRMCASLFVAGVDFDLTQLHRHRSSDLNTSSPSTTDGTSLPLPLRLNLFPFGETVFHEGRRMLNAENRMAASTPQSGNDGIHDAVEEADISPRQENSDEAAQMVMSDAASPGDSDQGQDSSSRPAPGEPSVSNVGAGVELINDAAEESDCESLLDHGFPLLGNVSHFIDQKELLVERVLDLDRDFFLHDHVFIQVTDYKPLEECLPLLPMAAMVEAMSEAASCLVPGCGIIGVEQMRALRWVALQDQRTLPIQIKAHVESVDEERNVVAVRTELSSNGEVNAMATVLLGTAYQETLPLNFSPRDGERTWPFSSEEFYRDQHTFHGPRLQCLTATLETGAHGGDGLLEVLPVDDWFADDPEPNLLLDPATLDGVAQVIALWARGYGKYSLPMGFRKFELYGPTPAPGTQVPFRIEATKGDATSRTFVFDVEVQDGHGNVWMRFQGFSLWVFDWTIRGIEAQRRPDAVYLSEAQQWPGQPNDMVVASVGRTVIPGGNLDWICRLCLTHPEIDLFNTLDSPRKKWEWLYGRLAAKDAVRMWMRQHFDIEQMHPLSFAILNDEQGCPYVQLLEDRPGVPFISISHVQDRSFAAVSHMPVGIDVEPADREIDTAAKTFITSPEEFGLMASMAGVQEESQSLLRLWCAKESVGKSLGIGLDGRPNDLVAIEADSEGRLLIQHLPTNQQYVAQTWDDGVYTGSFVIAECSDSVYDEEYITETNGLSLDPDAWAIRLVSVIGAGTQGWRIAWQCAIYGYTVRLYDTSDAALQEALDQMEDCANEMASSGQLQVGEARSAFERVLPTLDVTEAADADLLCESVPEQLELKKEVFADFHQRCPPHTIFVTNTSMFLPSMLAADTGRPSQFAALHFHGNLWDTNVADIMPHPGTDESTVRILEDFATSIGQIPIIMKKQSYGYVVNAMLMSLNRVALTLAANEVVEVEDIDRAFMAVLKTDKGPFGLIDQVGLQTSYQILHYWADVFKDPQLRKNAEFLKHYLDQGLDGEKSGRGFYSYPDPNYELPGFITRESVSPELPDVILQSEPYA